MLFACAISRLHKIGRQPQGPPGLDVRVPVSNHHAFARSYSPRAHGRHQKTGTWLAASACLAVARHGALRVMRAEINAGELHSVAEKLGNHMLIYRGKVRLREDSLGDSGLVGNDNDIDVGAGE